MTDDPKATPAPTPAASTPRNNAKITRGRPFKAGNPGRPKGSHNPTKAWLDSLTDDDHAVAHKKMTKLLRAGDRVVVRAYLSVRKVVGTFKLPKTISTLEDVDAAILSLAHAQAAGLLSPDEATAALATIESIRETIRDKNAVKMLEQLEARFKS
jgi:hypothetical protein